jgi:hypothetical protein
MRTLSLVFRVALLGVSARAAAQVPPIPWLVNGPEFPIATTTTGNQTGASVATGANHGYVVAWTSDGQDGDGAGIVARVFDANGEPATAEFQVNTTTTGKQYDAAVASDSDGNFVVVWAGFISPGPYTEIFARRFDAAGNPHGGEFQVNTYTTGYQYGPAVAMSDGGFVVTWTSLPIGVQPPQDGDDGGVYGRRYDANGIPVAGEFLVNTQTTANQGQSSVAMNTSGQFVVVWSSSYHDGDVSGVFGQRFTSGGAPDGAEFQANSYTTGDQTAADVAIGSVGDFVVAWQSQGQDGDQNGIFARAFDFLGVSMGPDFQVNTYTTGAQTQARVAKYSGLPGGFVVAWQSLGQDDPAAPAAPGIFAQRFRNGPFPTAAFALTQPPRQGVEYPINTYTTGNQAFPDVEMGPDGRFLVAWDSTDQDGSAAGVFARRFGFPPAGMLQVDERASGGTSNVNGILEPGERVTVDPSWLNPDPVVALPLTGAAANLTGPPGPAYTIDDAAADYGTIATETTNDCFTATGDCYEISIGDVRPVAHWDATFDETLASPLLGGTQPLTKTWALHVGGSFPDVPQDAFYLFIENLFHNRITGGGGCGPGLYCGEDGVLRQQMAVFLLKALLGGDYVPPPATGTVFDDVPVSNPFAPWIEELARKGITGGCVNPPPPALPSYCPVAVVNRQQMAVFLIKTLYGTTLTPVDCAGLFEDVPCANPFAPWVEFLVGTGITGGCQVSPALYCPVDQTKRKQMAVFLVRTFGLQLYGAD